MGRLTLSCALVAAAHAVEAAAVDLFTDPEVASRLAAVQVAVEAQVEADRCGTPSYTAAGLIRRDDKSLRDAALHQFGLAEPFSSLTPKRARRRQRGGRRSVQQSSSDSNSTETQDQIDAICQTEVSFPPCCLVHAGWETPVHADTYQPASRTLRVQTSDESTSFKGRATADKSRSLLQQPSDCSIVEGQNASSEREEHFQTTEIHIKYETNERAKQAAVPGLMTESPNVPAEHFTLATPPQSPKVRDREVGALLPSTRAEWQANFQTLRNK